MSDKTIATTKNQAGAEVQIYETSWGYIGYKCAGCTYDYRPNINNGNAQQEAQEHASTCSFLPKG